MRLSRSRIRARVKGDLPIVFSDERISAHGGLELFRRYLAAIDLPGRLRSLFRDTALDGDFGAIRMALLLIGGGAISDLSLFLVVGIIAGSYSTIYIASPMVLAWERFRGRRAV